MVDPSYRSVAVASAFSPRFAHVLSEGKRISERFGSILSLIYVGEQTDETTARFSDIFDQLKLPPDSVVHYQQGDPAAAIIWAAAANNVELVIAGALEKEAVLRPFLGDVARRLVREAGCSVMLFTKPETDPKPLRKIVFIAEYSDHGSAALKRTIRLAQQEHSDRLYVIRVHTTFDAARAKRQKARAKSGKPLARSLEEEEVALEQFIDSIGPTDVPIEARCIRGNTGYAASDFVQSVEADLLVVPVEPTKSARLPSHVAWVTDVIPCNLWVIR